MFYVNWFVNSKLKEVSLRNKTFLNIGGILNVSLLGFISPILDKQHVHLKVYWQHFVDVPKRRSFFSVLLSSLFSICRVVGTFLLPILLLTFTVLLKLVTLFQEILNLVSSLTSQMENRSFQYIQTFPFTV